MIKIVTDSTAGMPPEISQQYGIVSVPLYVHFGNETFRDGVDLHSAEFFSRLKSAPQLPTTSQPSAGDFLQVYKELTADGSEIISIHVSCKLSGTVDSARAARDMLPGARIHVVDTQSIMVGLALMVTEGARMAAAGQDAPAILARLDKLIAGFRIYFVVDTLEYLQKGGRIGKAAALLGTALQMKPILMISEGAVEAKERIRSKSKAVARMLELVAQETAGCSRLVIGVLYSTALEEARQLEADLVARLSPAETMIAEIGPVVSVHAGPGALGVAFYAE
jgi:DegV family protein with EDD domain